MYIDVEKGTALYRLCVATYRRHVSVCFKLIRYECSGKFPPSARTQMKMTETIKRFFPGPICEVNCADGSALAHRHATFILAALALALLAQAAPAAHAQGSRKDDIVFGPAGHPVAGA